ncbi:P-II family nitrogen regulator [Olsenella sp. YH-ols2217]|uniref:P-II family nitrogen regulator n=1 Tax=Kribbibacterium absianum TaxID=3044210 RepID=A0ABT6ZHT1_9ACTN|nr:MULTISPECIES: P-II family nitrogen regulator [unclassified Olsenella]MDJ1121124.1 P-II family nitrogen regulator [Olsenella sp. YH-ols2216]MDJ1128615.1 P-II family nitrogen regulator [Olsenella sp. YH-ols2217]
MKRIEAIVRPERTSRVRDALVAAGAAGMTVTQVQGMGSLHGFLEEGVTDVTQVLPKTRIDIVCRDEDVERFVEAVIGAARTGEPGDGKVFVSPVEEAVRIRNGKRGDNALVAEEL